MLFVKSLYENVSHYGLPNVYKTCTTTIAEDPVYVKFRVVTSNNYKTRTTTSTTVAERLLPLHRIELEQLRKMHASKV